MQTKSVQERAHIWSSPFRTFALYILFFVSEHVWNSGTKFYKLYKLKKNTILLYANTKQS